MAAYSVIMYVYCVDLLLLQGVGGGAQPLPLDWGQGPNNLNTAAPGVFAASTDATFPSALEGNYVQVEGRPDKTLMGFV